MRGMEAPTLGRRLLELRRANGKSQQLVADFCGISQAALCRYEQGKRIPDVRILFALAQFYGLSLDALCGVEKDFFDLYRAG